MKYVLSLQDYRVQSIRRTHPALQGTKLLGRGMFCAVFAPADERRVLKLTTDRSHVDYLTDRFAPRGRLKPRVFENFGIIGETCEGFSLYLLEVERLQKIRRGSSNARLVRRIQKEMITEHGSLCFPTHASRVPAKASILKFMKALNRFTGEFTCDADSGSANFMERADGTLVFNDPVFDMALRDRAQHLKYHQ